MEIDYSTCATNRDSNASVSANFKIGDIRYIAPNKNNFILKITDSKSKCQTIDIKLQKKLPL